MRLFVTRCQREDQRGRVIYEAHSLLALDAGEAVRFRQRDADRAVVLQCLNLPPHGPDALPEEIRVADLRRRHVFRARDYYEIHRFEEQLRAACRELFEESPSVDNPALDAAAVGAELLLLYRELMHAPVAITRLDEKCLQPWRGRPVPAPVLAGLRELAQVAP